MPEICVTCFVYFLLNTVKKTKVRGSKNTDLSDSQLLDMIYLFDVISILMVFALKDKFNHKKESSVITRSPSCWWKVGCILAKFALQCFLPNNWSGWGLVLKHKKKQQKLNRTAPYSFPGVIQVTYSNWLYCSC